MIRSSTLPEWQVSQWFNQKTPLQLSDLRGRVVMVHAFQMLCPGCVSHGLPQAERIYRHFSSEQLAVIGLHTVFEHHRAMTPIALEAFLHEYRITHPVGVDQPVQGQAIPATMQAWKMHGTPSVFLFDQTGRLRLHEFGRLDDLTLGTTIGRLMAGPGRTSGVDAPTEQDPHSTGTDCDDHGCRAGSGVRLPAGDAVGR